MSNILQHLKQRLAQKNLRQQLTRSKTITPILDAVSEAAKLEGISADEIVADFVSGKNEHPVISAALGKTPTRQDAQRSMQELAKTRQALTAPKPAARPAPRPAAKNELQTYLAMKPGPAKSAYLRENAVKIQSQAKNQ